MHFAQVWPGSVKPHRGKWDDSLPVAENIEVNDSSSSGVQPGGPYKFPTRPWRGRRTLVLGIAMLALNIRLAVTAVSPVIDRLRGDIPLSDELYGWLGTIPVICFAMLGIATPKIARQLGLEWATVLALGLSVAGQLGRALSDGSVEFVAWTVVAMAGLGISNVLLPPLVKAYFPDRMSLVTGIYVTSLTLSSAIPALAAVPLADSGGWRFSLGIWGAFGAAAMVPWLFAILRDGGARLAPKLPAPAVAQTAPTRDEPPVVGKIWRSPSAWGMGVMMGLNSFIVYVMFAWLPTMLTDASVPEATAGTMLATYSFLGIAGAFLGPWMINRARHYLLVIFAVLSMYLVGFGGLLLAPGAAPWLWITALGLGGSVFQILLALINVKARSTSSAAQLSGFAQGLGYTLAALGPVLVGYLHGAGAGWNVVYLVLLGCVLITAAAAPVVTRRTVVEDEW